MVGQFVFVAFAKRSKSSAKNRCEKIEPFLDVLMPVQFLQDFSVSMRAARYSMQRMNKYSDRGHLGVCLLKGKRSRVFHH